MAVESFGTERDDIKSNRFQKLKMKTGDEIRCGILFFDESGKKMFLGTKVHVKPQQRTFLCKSTKTKKEVCCTHSWEGNNSRYHIGCVIVIYNLGKGGSGTKLQGYELTPWVFWEKTYEKLVSADKEFSLVSHDLKLKCTNDEYQTIDIQSCKESIWTSNETLKKKFLEEGKSIYEGISRNLGADLNITDIKELLGIEITGDDDAATDVDLGDVVNSIE